MVYGVPPGADVGDELAQMQKQAEAEGKLVLFNPPPVRPYHCPNCGSELIDK